MFSKAISIKPLILPILAAIILAIAGCATDEAVGAEATQPVVQPSPTFESIEVTVVPTPTQSAVSSDDISAGADLSADQQAVLDIWNTQAEVIRNEDWARLQESCHPGYAELENRTITQIEDHFTEFVYEFWRVQPSELEFGTPSVQIIGGIQAIVGLEIINSGGSTEPFGIFMTKLEDGKWYDDCAIGGWKSLFLTPAAAGNAVDLVEPTPYTSLSDQQVSELKAETENAGLIEFPPSLLKGSEPLDDETVLELWYEYMTGSRVSFKAGGFLVEFCGDGRGKALYEVGTPYMTDAPLDWKLLSDPGSSWHSVALELYFDDIPTYTNKASGRPYLRIGLLSPMIDRPVYNSPDC